MATGVSAGGFFYVQMPGLAVFFFVLYGLADGRVARLGTGSTPWGGALDLVCDRIVEAAILLSITPPYSHLHAPGLVDRGEGLFFAVFAGFRPQRAAAAAHMYAALEVITAIQRFVGGRRELRGLR